MFDAQHQQQQKKFHNAFENLHVEFLESCCLAVAL